MYSRCRPVSDAFSVIPAQAGIQRFRSLALDPGFRGGDEIKQMTRFSHSLGGKPTVANPAANGQWIKSDVLIPSLEN